MRRADFLRLIYHGWNSPSDGKNSQIGFWAKPSLSLGTTLAGSVPARASSAGDPNWVLACEQEGNGHVRSGSLEAAARAVARGADLCVYTTPSHRQFEESIPLAQTYWNADGAFAGFWSAPSGDLLSSAADAGAESFYVYSPAGASRIYWGDRGVSERVMPRPHYLVYRWFVRDCWTVAYEADAAGAGLSGSLEGVRSAVRRGLGIKIGIKDLFDADAPGAKVPEHWTFVESGLNLAFLDAAEGLTFATRRATIAGGRWPLALEAATFHPARMRVRTSGEVGLSIETFAPRGHAHRRLRRAIRVLATRA